MYGKLWTRFFPVDEGDWAIIQPEKNEGFVSYIATIYLL